MHDIWWASECGEHGLISRVLFKHSTINVAKRNRNTNGMNGRNSPWYLVTLVLVAPYSLSIYVFHLHHLPQMMSQLQAASTKFYHITVTGVTTRFTVRTKVVWKQCTKVVWKQSNNNSKLTRKIETECYPKSKLSNMVISLELLETVLARGSLEPAGSRTCISAFRRKVQQRNAV